MSKTRYFAYLKVNEFDDNDFELHYTKDEAFALSMTRVPQLDLYPHRSERDGEKSRVTKMSLVKSSQPKPILEKIKNAICF